MTYLVIAIVIVGLFIGFFLKEYFDARSFYLKRLEKAKKSYGKLSEREYTEDELTRIKTLSRRIADPDTIDEITASDIDFDRLFLSFNASLSSCGDEYFYYRLGTPLYDGNALSELESKVTEIKENEKERWDLMAEFMKIGAMRNVNFFDCIDLCAGLASKRLFQFFVPIITFVFALLATIFLGAPGVAILVFVIAYNIITYYKKNGDISVYVICFKFIVNLLNAADSMTKKEYHAIESEQDAIRGSLKKLSSFRKLSRLVTGASRGATGVGNPLDILADYLKMIFHTDIIGFYLMLDSFKKNKEEIENIYINVGKAETYITIASMREAYPVHAIPVDGEGLKGVNLYHPLIEDPVKNSITTGDKCVLITGSNASGKSTFLKTVALNALFSKSIHTCFADSFSMGQYRIASSMSLRDDLENHDSYFMVEIKALKRIMDKASDGDPRPVLCFLDEVLRGTNTIERISACTVILRKLKEAGVLCFAATHDLELTRLLQDDYENYHFDETVTGNDILFNYVMKEGPSVTRNAIKLLSLMGFEDSLIEDANRLAGDFETTGRWNVKSE